jgi:hypothetical protein
MNHCSDEVMPLKSQSEENKVCYCSRLVREFTAEKSQLKHEDEEYEENIVGLCKT